MSSNSTRESGRRLEEVATAVAKARVLAGMTKGRYPITYDPVWFMTRLDHLQRMYTVARLLQLDVMLHAQQGEVDGALDSCRPAQRRPFAGRRADGRMVALERYRRAHGCWPDVPELLVPSVLRALPADPYTALPITVTHRDGGLSVYSLGPDRRDDGGNYHKILNPVAGTDQGYRLWDVSRRRQTPPAP